MNLDKLTNKSREALLNSRQIAVEHHHNELRVLHVLAALLADDNGLVPSIFEKCGVNRAIFASPLDNALNELPRLEGNSGGDVYNSREFSELLSDASRHAENMKDEYISVEHLLLAIFNSKSRARELLENSGITLSGINFTGLPDISSIDYRRLPEDTAKPGAVNILLTHSPDGVIAADKGKFLCNFTAAFCGHTHGGQIRLPLIGSLYCPSFYRCKFDRGVFGRRGSDFKVIISSGIGEHRKGFRLFCPPEVVIAELVCR